MMWILVGAIAGGLLVWFLTRSRRRPRTSLSALRRELRKLTHDPAVAERLVEAERQRNPELDEASVLRRVIRRLGRDRHR